MVGRGVKQGCPLSVILLCLYMKMLAHYITAHDKDCRIWGMVNKIIDMT